MYTVQMRPWDAFGTTKSLGLGVLTTIKKQNITKISKKHYLYLPKGQLYIRQKTFKNDQVK